MKTPARNGKIARLPKIIREELNRRLEDGESARALVAWLNGLPEVQALVASQFGGHAIREPNLSHWKQGGFRDWLARQEALEYLQSLGESAEEMAAREQQQPLHRILSLWTGARYAVATRALTETEGQEGWKMLREMCADVMKMRRVELQTERLQLERERVALHRARVELELRRGEPEEEEDPAVLGPWTDWSDEQRLDWGKANTDLLNKGRHAEADLHSRGDRLLGKEKEETRQHAQLRIKVDALWALGRREWSVEERTAWARLPENFDLIMADRKLTNEDRARRIRAIYEIPTPEDKVYYARVNAASRGDGQQHTEGVD